VDIFKLKSNNQILAIKTTLKVLRNRGLIVYPTETCFGLGADATNQKAVEKVFQFKGERNKPISIAVADQKMAEKYVKLNQTALNLYQNFLPGPLTVISLSQDKVVKKLESNRKTLGVRIPNFPFTLRLIEAFKKPITTTSANASNAKPPFSLKDFQKYTSQERQNLIDLFIDPGELPKRESSTVVDTTLNETEVLRQGQIFFPHKKAQKFVSNSEKETRKIAQKMTETMRGKNLPIIFALQGELGAGKTQFAKGIALNLGIEEPITSPTFTLIKEYPFDKNTFYHLDTWRLEEGKEIIDLGFNKMLQGKNLIAIEWLEKVKPILEKAAQEKKAKVIWIKIEPLTKNKRKILIYE